MECSTEASVVVSTTTSLDSSHLESDKTKLIAEEWNFAADNAVAIIDDIEYQN